MSDLLDQLAIIHQEMRWAAEMSPEQQAVSLIAVSKQQPEERIDAALQANIRIFGENRVQEAHGRWQERRTQYPDLELHLIGPLQTNKAADAVALFDYIHTVDRPKLARILSEEMQKQDRHLPCFIQVNTGLEPQKAGILPEDCVDFVDICRGEYGLNICGLMCIPPIDEEPVMHFALLKKLAKQANLTQLSMGMSDDFPAAIQLGASHIRVGSRLFGARLPRE